MIMTRERQGSVVTTRRARRQLDEAAGLLEMAAFAALMSTNRADFIRIGACTDALTVLTDLGARPEVTMDVDEQSCLVTAAVDTLRATDPVAFADPHHAAVVRQLADDLHAHLLDG